MRKAVSAYFTSKQIQPFAFAEQYMFDVSGFCKRTPREEQLLVLLIKLCQPKHNIMTERYAISICR